jgi:hypothetical protein
VAARPDITLKPCASASPEQARDARAQAWNYVFQCWQEKQNAAGRTSTNGGDEKERSRNDSLAKTRIP